jgi:hypothetical protein
MIFDRGAVVAVAQKEHRQISLIWLGRTRPQEIWQRVQVIVADAWHEWRSASDIAAVA